MINAPENKQTDSEETVSDQPRRTDRIDKAVPPDIFIYVTQHDSINGRKSGKKWKK